MGASYLPSEAPLPSPSSSQLPRSSGEKRALPQARRWRRASPHFSADEGGCLSRYCIFQLRGALSLIHPASFPSRDNRVEAAAAPPLHYIPYVVPDKGAASHAPFSHQTREAL